MKGGREFKSRLDHHSVHPILHFLENRSKSARVRGFARAGGPRESSKAALRRRIGQKLSGRHFGRSILAPAGKRPSCPKGGLHNNPKMRIDPPGEGYDGEIRRLAAFSSRLPLVRDQFFGRRHEFLAFRADDCRPIDLPPALLLERYR